MNSVLQSEALSERPSATMQSRTPFASMCVLFFVWGFLMTWNDLLIPRFRDVFQLSFFRAMLVQFAFSGGYAVGSPCTTYAVSSSATRSRGSGLRTGLL